VPETCTTKAVSLAYAGEAETRAFPEKIQKCFKS
jgi:hypothetical protein